LMLAALDVFGRDPHLKLKHVAILALLHHKGEQDVSRL
jgi:hypothetical protein